MFNYRSPMSMAVVASLVFVMTVCSSKASWINSGLTKGAEFVRAADWHSANVEACSNAKVSRQHGAQSLRAQG